MAYTLNDAALSTVTGDFAGNDHFGLDGATNGPRKVLCSRFVLNDKSYADPSWITSLAASKVGLGSVENKSSATIRGEITSGNVTTALGFTPYNATNPSAYITSSALSPYLTTATAASTYQTALVSGTSIKTINGNSVLGSGDITISASSVTYSAVITALGYTPYNATNPNGYTSNTGTVTSVSGAGTVSGLTLTGSVTTSGSLTLGGTLSLTSGNVTTALGFTPYNSSNPSGYITSASLSSYLPLSGGSNMTGSFGLNDSKLYLRGNGDNNHALWNAADDWEELIAYSGTGFRVASSTGTTLATFTTSAVNAGVALQQGGNQVLHAGNYTSYSPSLTGSGASGTWGINVTGNASNITAYTINQSLGTGNGPTFAEVYSNGWFRNTGTQGLYNSSYGHHFYATSSQYFNLAGNDGSVCGLILRTGGHQGSIRGYLYADSSNNVGWLSQDGNWQIRCNNSEVELYDTSYANDFRSYITHDRNDTAYYLDANSTSYLNVTGTNKIRADSNRNFGDSNQGWWTHDPYGYGWGKPHGSFRTLEVSSSGNFSTEPALFRMHQWGSGAAEFWKPQGTTLYLRETPGGGGSWFTRFYLEGYGETNGSWRAPQFIDNNDTAYYLDPNGTSELSTLTAATRTRWDMPCRTFNRQQYNSGSNYWTGTRGWGSTINWNQAWGYGFGGFDIWGTDTQHPQGNGYIHAQGLCSGLHHTTADGNASYGFQLVGGTNASDRLWYRGAWGNTGNSWREIPMFDVNSGNGNWMWFAGWYDNNNSGYYVDPNGTSRMNAVVADNLYAYGTVTAYYSDDRLKTRFSNIADALDKVCSLNGFFYVGNEVAESLGYKKKMEVGLSAQEMQRVLPEVVVPAPVDENYLTIQYDRVVPLLVEAIKELRLELNQLKSLVRL